jgi:hypothetical protein
MILSFKVRFDTYEESKTNYVKLEFSFDGLGVWKRDPSGSGLSKEFISLLE